MKSFALLIASSVVCFIGSIGSLGAIGAYADGVSREASSQIDELKEVPAVALDDHPGLQILSDWALRAWCLIGSIVGAWLYIVIVPEKEPANTKRLAGKFTAAAAGGITMTPMVVSLLGVPQTVDWTAGLATLVAFSMIGILVDAGPIIKNWAVSFIKAIISK